MQPTVWKPGVEKNTDIGRAKARALIQIYDAIVKSGVKWPRVKHLGWAKLRAIAGVLDAENADYWIEMASNHSKAEIIKAVQEHGNENWLFDADGYMAERHASINDVRIAESERLFRWPQGRRSDDHPGLTELGL